MKKELLKIIEDLVFLCSFAYFEFSSLNNDELN